jgi:C4-dicarboxylate transporter, DctM subunit
MDTGLAVTEAPGTAAGIPGGLRGAFRTGEDLALSAVLAAMVMIPLLEIVLRPTLRTGISGATALVQHLTLVTSMLGGAIAAREGRLLSLSTLSTFLKGRPAAAAQAFSHGFAAAVAAGLCFASIQYVLQERSNPRDLVYGIRLWVVELILPLGFAAIALRLLQGAGKTRGWLSVAAGVALIAGTLSVWPPVSPGAMIVPALMALLAATLLGAPIFVTLGGAALILFWGSGGAIASMPIEHYTLAVNPSLPAIPLFTLAGYLLAEGGAARRLIRVFRSLVGQFRGGSAVATVLVCAFFTSFTGASGVTILALGGLLMPVLIAAGYSEKNALGLLTGAGSLGLLLPPCLPIILYAIIARIEIKDMFLAGLAPAVLLMAAAAILGILQGPAVRGGQSPEFDWREAGRVVWHAKWELLIPVVALSAMFSGLATPVEASAATAFYAFVIETFVYRDLRVGTDLRRVLVECGLIVGGVLLILGVAKGFAYYLVDAQVPDLMLDWATRSIHSPLVFLLAVNVLLLIVGCLMDIYSAIVVVVPLILPIGSVFGVHPIHLGVIFLANLELGYLTPPVGLNLFLSSYRFHKPMPEVTRSVVPILLVLLAGVLLITYVPPISTYLPSLFEGTRP